MDFLRKLSLSKHWGVILVLCVSLILRWMLIFQGGQYYFPDEIKYDYSKNIAASISQNDISKAFGDLTVTPGQIVFRALGIIPALVEQHFHLPASVPAVFFSLFSVANLYLIWKIAKRAGMPDRGAWFALLVAAASHSLLYYTRHLLPYDVSMFFGLWALYTGLKPGADSITFLATGSLCFLCFATYSGYWSLAGFAAVLPAAIHVEGGLSFFRRSFFIGAGIIVSFFVLALLLALSANGNIFANYMDFAGTITQGNFSEGWSLPFAYLWYSEHFLLISLIALSLYAVLNFSQENQRVFVTGVAGILFIYLCLFIPSTILHKFVVYGRLARQLIPFLVITSAYGLLVLGNSGKIGNTIAKALLAVVIVQGIVNYRASAQVIFPREFIKQAQVKYPAFKMSLKRTNTGAPFVCKYRDYIAVNVKYIYPTPEVLPAIEENVLLSAPHPINFLPYQYEGYSPDERTMFRKENVKMKLLRVVDDSQALAMFGELKNCVATVQE